MTDETPRRPVDAIRDFLHDEAAGGVVLLLAAAAALLWANSPWPGSYVHVWHTELTLGRGSWAVTEDLQHWVNDGLMAVFFFVVGLEIKRELVAGELRDRRAAVLPAVAAAGGVVLPALLFLAIVRGGDAARGWGVPMATDIAFAAGVLAVLGRGAGAGTRLFLLSIAIVDDLIAIGVIAVFYTGTIHLSWLVAAAVAVVAIVVMRRWFASPWAYVLPALVLWFTVLESGVHATVAGVLLGLLTPVGPFRGREVALDLEHRLHPVSAFAVVPLFALANAGVYLRDGALTTALTQRLTWAVVVGLVVGKTVGICGSTFGLLRLRLGALPAGMARREVWPVGALGGIGFTVALFVADLAFPDPGLGSQAKVGILLGSVLAAVAGGVLLRAVSARPAGASPPAH